MRNITSLTAKDEVTSLSPDKGLSIPPPCPSNLLSHTLAGSSTIGKTVRLIGKCKVLCKSSFVSQARLEDELLWQVKVPEPASSLWRKNGAEPQEEWAGQTSADKDGHRISVNGVGHGWECAWRTPQDMQGPGSFVLAF